VKIAVEVDLAVDVAAAVVVADAVEGLVEVAADATNAPVSINRTL
jgi:hypothetical protein